jgi:hypothetical protein
VILTRLASAAAMERFLKLRYRQAYPFSGSAGSCSSPGTQLGTWQDSTDRTRGPWGARRTKSGYEVLWGYSDTAIALVASGSRDRATAVCNVWYSHSG